MGVDVLVVVGIITSLEELIPILDGGPDGVIDLVVVDDDGEGAGGANNEDLEGGIRDGGKAVGIGCPPLVVLKIKCIATINSGISNLPSLSISLKFQIVRRSSFLAPDC